MLYSSTGILCYSAENNFNVRVVIDPEITRYYRSLIPKYIVSQPQMYEPHISVVRREVPTNLDAWYKHQGKEIRFKYSNEIRASENYIWLDVYAKELEMIRLELGLAVHSQYTLPPSGFEHCFHTTLGNFKRKVPVPL